MHDINNEKYVFLSWKFSNYQQVGEIKGFINQHHHIKFKVITKNIDGLHNNLNYKDMMSQDELTLMSHDYKKSSYLFIHNSNFMYNNIIM